MLAHTHTQETFTHTLACGRKLFVLILGMEDTNMEKYIYDATNSLVRVAYAIESGAISTVLNVSTTHCMRVRFLFCVSAGDIFKAD